MPQHRPQPAAILTISDSVSKKKRQDLSGPALKEVLKANGYAVVLIKVVPDEKSKISTALKQLAKKARLVVSTGGVPTAAMRTGNFSGTGYTVYDPTTVTCIRTSGTGCSQYNRAAFPAKSFAFCPPVRSSRSASSFTLLGNAQSQWQ